VRNAAYDHRLFGVYRPPVPVVAVGNLTAGGTGKTPVVAWITSYLRARQARPAILSRGYGRSSKGVRVVSDGEQLLTDAREGGDEPVQLARSFPDVPVVVGESRSDAAREALARFAPGVLLLDDAYQHRAIARDLNVLIVDGSRDLAAEAMLPAGRRREPLSALQRASVVVFTHADPVTGRAAGEETVRRWFAGPLLICTRAIGSFVDRRGSALETDQMTKERSLLVSGIGRPEQFERDILAQGITVAGHMRYRDHFRFTQEDVRAIATAAANAGVQRIVTTEKDMVRLMSVEGAMDMLESKVVVAAAQLSVQVEPAHVLRSLIDAVLVRTA
jgi:tetraacyldisaccharide 4'-kinase